MNFVVYMIFKVYDSSDLLQTACKMINLYANITLYYCSCKSGERTLFFCGKRKCLFYDVSRVATCTVTVIVFIPNISTAANSLVCYMLVVIFISLGHFATAML